MMLQSAFRLNGEITASFDDVKEDAWYAQAIRTAASLGIIAGMGDGTFAPAESLTRAQAATMIAKLMNVPNDVKGADFSDVNEKDWFYSYVAKASDAGILQGSPVEKEFIFRPADNTTRQEMAIIASRLLGINCGAFEDVKLPYKDLSSIADWSLGYVKVAYKMGIMKGDGTNFNPGAPITRQEAMAMFARMYGLKGSADLTQFKDHAQVASWAKAEVEAVVAEGIIEGYDGYLNPTAFITRAEIATIISRVI
jgi:hypothetical protein